MPKAHILDTISNSMISCKLRMNYKKIATAEEVSGPINLDDIIYYPFAIIAYVTAVGVASDISKTLSNVTPLGNPRLEEWEITDWFPIYRNNLGNDAADNLKALGTALIDEDISV